MVVLKKVLLPEIPLQQALEGFAVPGFVASHLMHGVVDGVQVQGLGLLGELGFPGLGDRAESLCLLVF